MHTYLTFLQETNARIVSWAKQCNQKVRHTSPRYLALEHTVTGQAITFDVGKSVCGPEFEAKDSDLVAALHQKHWKHPNPTKDLNCARSVKITELESSKEKSVIAKVYTKCIHGCKIPDIALSDAAFKKLSKDGGTSLKVTWDFKD
ncbi:uncharacterized protein LOC110860249 isoform X1 [Folsomia candida]|uniref:uncharacterized protein LOC110860249 isoform X1 n=1 Tax=Folsomia candida TaxID=158441 RepID=UPI000B901E20|nr:uncharacterized protein LOC110860249 isoform X1 [Folsomia candida]XP_035716004.1 uncharacterized protein LOC110860249 isoform X1 [Folsomia candida]XP_035716005.1 uncharacterized protein LOC110860249 isoform X1 [Folsomia candida]